MKENYKKKKVSCQNERTNSLDELRTLLIGIAYELKTLHTCSVTRYVFMKHNLDGCDEEINYY